MHADRKLYEETFHPLDKQMLTYNGLADAYEGMLAKAVPAGTVVYVGFPKPITAPKEDGIYDLWMISAGGEFIRHDWRKNKK